MSIVSLTDTVIPPSKPLEPGDLALWTEIQRNIGVSLPDDYRDFGLVYGTGFFGDADRTRIYVLNPFSKEYLERFHSMCETLRHMKEVSSDEVPYDIFPLMPGLLPWGRDDNGFRLCWLTEGNPNEWPVVVTHGRDIYFDRHETTMTFFLARSFRRQIDTVAWSDPVFFSEPGRLLFTASDEYF